MVYLVLKKIFALFLVVMTFFTNLSVIGREVRKVDDAGIRVHYGEGKCEYYDMYLPENRGGGKIDVVLMIHGGAWIFGDQTEFAEDCKTAANEYGYAAVTVDYNKIFNGATSADMVEEVYSAVSSVKDILEENGYSAGKMAVTGHSAGAHIALIYSYTHFKDSPIDIAFTVSNSAPSDFFDEDGSGTTKMEKFSYLAVSGLIGELVIPGYEAESDEKIKYNNPIDLVNSDVPPTIVVHGEKDTMVSYSNSVNLYSKLCDFGVDSVFISYPNSEHFLQEDAEMDEVRAKAFFDFAQKYMNNAAELR